MSWKGHHTRYVDGWQVFFGHDFTCRLVGAVPVLSHHLRVETGCRKKPPNGGSCVPVRSAQHSTTAAPRDGRLEDRAPRAPRGGRPHGRSRGAAPVLTTSV